MKIGFWDGIVVQHDQPLGSLSCAVTCTCCACVSWSTWWNKFHINTVGDSMAGVVTVIEELLAK